MFKEYVELNKITEKDVIFVLSYIFFELIVNVDGLVYAVIFEHLSKSPPSVN